MFTYIIVRKLINITAMSKIQESHFYLTLPLFFYYYLLENFKTI